LSRFLRLVGRDLHLALRQGSDATVAVMFFVLCVVLFPFGVGPEANILARIAAGVIWVAALLASLLSLERLFQNDFEDGSLELLTLTTLPLEAVVLAKTLAHWLVTGLPLIVAAPLLALLLNMRAEGFGVLVLTLLIGTPTLSLIGAIGAALTLGARRGGVLMSLLILPLYIPVLIFGAGAIDAALAGFPSRPHLLLLCGLLAAALPLAPWASAAALRQAIELSGFQEVCLRPLRLKSAHSPRQNAHKVSMVIQTCCFLEYPRA
jgi:heme exporter protein B